MYLKKRTETICLGTEKLFVVKKKVFATFPALSYQGIHNLNWITCTIFIQCECKLSDKWLKMYI